MKTRLLTIFVLGIIGLLVATNPQYVDGLCMENQDWPDAPCYGFRTQPGQIDEKKDWEPYYDYKGSEFMEAKKTELLEAINDNRLDEWRIEGPENQNNNVFLYYYFQGVIPHEDGKFYEEHMQEEMIEYYKEQLAEGNIPIGNIFVSVYLFVIIAIIGIVIFVIFRRIRK